MQSQGEFQKNKLVIFGLLLVLTLAALLTWSVRYGYNREEVDTAAAELLADNSATPYLTLNGEPFSFSTYRGKVRVVNVWASWSPLTERELPILNQLVTDYESVGIVTVALNRKEPLEWAKAYLSAIALQPKVVYVIDETDAFYTSVGGYAMPETVIFDQNGNLAWHHRGEISYELVKTEIEKLIQN